MKYYLIALLILIPTLASAARCLRDNAYENRCLVIVKSTWTPQCNAGAASPTLPVTWGFADFIDPYILISAAKTATACDVELQDCMDLAFRELQKYTHTNNCGATTVGDSATYEYQFLNSDGEVIDTVSGRFKK